MTIQAGVTTIDQPPLIRLQSLWSVAAALLVMIVAIEMENLWFLNFVHVIAGVLWTGIDLFMGFVVGPVLRSVDPPVRKQIVLRLMPKMIFLMPTLSIVTGTAGWFLAQQMGFLSLDYPDFWWVVAALVIIGVLTIQGLGVLLPTNLRVCLELRKAEPDFPKIGAWMRTYIRAVALQGALQIAIIVVMAKFVTGI